LVKIPFGFVGFLAGRTVLDLFLWDIYEINLTTEQTFVSVGYSYTSGIFSLFCRQIDFDRSA
jgi:hypothetical protein